MFTFLSLTAAWMLFLSPALLSVLHERNRRHQRCHATLPVYSPARPTVDANMPKTVIL